MLLAVYFCISVMVLWKNFQLIPSTCRSEDEVSKIVKCCDKHKVWVLLFLQISEKCTHFLIWSLQVFCKNSAYHKHFRFNACGSQDSLSKSKDLIVNFQFGLSTFALVDHGMMKNEKYCLHVASIYLVCFYIVIRSL